MDGRKNNGGHSTKGYAGRKPKEDENRIRGLSINALETIYGSEEAAFEHIAEQAKDSFPHLKLLIEYAYGKPKETKNINTQVEQPLFVEDEFPYDKLSTEALKEIADIYNEIERSN
ncbi:hypothetical protein [Algibacter luteus]|uniref:Uncharacterized protein n=1 Tax=Algibacter luteus TaxID=1178825 RepID=A0A1M6DM74_9FLAO|nr:hypothetical protein [Algibacter luteus]SHI74417.1 hypothetical protein SAMN05216261_1644 [Algibacter luteus]